MSVVGPAVHSVGGLDLEFGLGLLAAYSVFTSITYVVLATAAIRVVTQMEDAVAVSRQFSDLPMVPVHVASAALHNTYHGAHTEYATQLLAGREFHPETLLEREDHVRQYAAASAYEDDERAHTVSLSA